MHFAFGKETAIGESMTTINDFVTQHNVRATVNRATCNPSMPDIWDGARHWRVTLKYGARSLTVPFSQGPAYVKAPMAAELYSTSSGDISWHVYRSADPIEDNGEYIVYERTSERADFIGAFDKFSLACRWVDALAAGYTCKREAPLRANLSRACAHADTPHCDY